MKDKLSGYVANLNKLNKNKKRWKKVVSVLIAIVVFCTTYALILPAITLDAETVCGLEEHTHTPSCYAMKEALICSPEDYVHSHSEECYDENGEIKCGEVDYIFHSHSEECYGVNGEIKCAFPQVVPHSHSEACYQVSEAVVSEGHKHSEECYENGELKCEKEEQEEKTEITGKQLICELEEIEKHEHSDECYSVNESGEKELSCGKVAVETHIHSAECYGEKEKTLVCEIPEHTHVYLCYRECPECGEIEGHKVECPYFEFECTCGAKNDEHKKSCPMYTSTMSIDGNESLLSEDIIAEDENDSVHRDKYVITDDNGNLELQLDVWTESLASDEPSEIVMVIDQSGSMYQAADGEDSYYTYSEFIARDNALERERSATNPGYFMVVTENVRYGTSSTEENWNGEVDSDRRYAVALVRYNEELGMWQRSHQVSTSEYQYENLAINPTFRDIENISWSTLEGANYDGTKAKYFKSLYGATVDAYHTLLEKIIQNKNAKVAVVGFSSPRSHGDQWIYNVNDGTGGVNFGGTGIFVDGEFVHANDLKESDYEDAWLGTATQEEIDKIELSISNLRSNYNQTCQEDGFLLANELFSKSDNSDVNRAVVFFTDGSPTSISSNETGVNATGTQGYDYAIAASYETKNTYNSKVYVYGPSNLATASKDEIFLQYLSSTYPYATSLDNSGNVYNDNNYYGFASNSEELSETFEQIAEVIFKQNQILNRGSIIKDVVTRYFNINGEVKVYEVPYVQFTDGTLGFETDTSNWKDITSNVTVTVNDQTIDVTNYDFSENSINLLKAGGNKLVIQIPIVRDPEFIGGNQVETNTTESGIYSEDGEPVDVFPVPDTDVTITPQIVIAPPLHFYLGDSFLEHVTIADMQDYMEVYVNDFKLDLTDTDNFGFDWENDYVDIDVIFLDENDNEMPNGFTDLRHDQVYKVKVVVTPLYEGAEQTVMTSNEGIIKVYYPELTFKDCYYHFGETTPESSILQEDGWLKDEVKWRDADGVYSDSEGITMNSTAVPEILMTCTTDYDGKPLPNVDVEVQVTVNSVGYADNTHSLCYFDWEACFPECSQSIDFHSADTASEEFYIHIISNIELPSTGGIGTHWYIFSGFALVLGALLLLYKNKRNLQRGRSD